jgi:DNA-binding PadR family transcriptional regulator
MTEVTAMTRRRGLTSPLALSVLATLSEGPMHPYEIARLLRHRGKDHSIKIRYGSLYTVVQNLEKRGLVAAEGTVRAGRRPERTVYRITGDGQAELEDRLRELVGRPVKEYPAFEAALSLAGVLPPDEIIMLLTDRLQLLEVELAGARATLRELVDEQRLPRIFLIESEYAVAMKQAEAGWVRGLLKELADGTLDGVEQLRTWHRTGEFPAEWTQRGWARTDRAMHHGSEVDEPG